MPRTRESSRSTARRRATGHASRGIFCLLLGLVWASSLHAQSPDEHASHHPGGAAPVGPAPAAGPAAAAAPPGAPAAAGGMGAGMGAMMAGMMPPSPSGGGGCAGGDCGSGAAKTPVYPALMTLPALTPEKRAEIDALATQQINEGMARLAKGSESLTAATQAGDNAAMHQAVGVMRQGLGELDAGIAARRVLSEGTAPRNLALGWFKREMNLSSPTLALSRARSSASRRSISLRWCCWSHSRSRWSPCTSSRCVARRRSLGVSRLTRESHRPVRPRRSPGNQALRREKRLRRGKGLRQHHHQAKNLRRGRRQGESAGTAPITPPAAPDTAKIESRASELWQERGRPVGSPEVDWSRAKDELAKATAKPPVPPSPGAPNVSTPPSNDSPPAGESVAATSASTRGGRP